MNPSSAVERALIFPAQAPFSPTLHHGHCPFPADPPLEIPVSIFCTTLSTLEVLSKYLIETLGLSVHESAVLLHRDYKTIWGAAQSAREKHDSSFNPNQSQSDLLIPLSLFYDRRLGMLEHLCYYLKHTCGKRYCDIGRMLRLDQRTIWMSCSRARRKLQS